MAPRLQELVGRVMVDPEFLADLQRTPEVILAAYDLSDEERAAIRSALGRLAEAPSSQRAATLRHALIRRLAT